MNNLKAMIQSIYPILKKSTEKTFQYFLSLMGIDIEKEVKLNVVFIMILFLCVNSFSLDFNLALRIANS